MFFSLVCMHINSENDLYTVILCSFWVLLCVVEDLMRARGRSRIVVVFFTRFGFVRFRFVLLLCSLANSSNNLLEFSYQRFECVLFIALNLYVRFCRRITTLKFYHKIHNAFFRSFWLRSICFSCV